jgi:hypothetical protein
MNGRSETEAALLSHIALLQKQLEAEQASKKSILDMLDRVMTKAINNQKVNGVLHGI